MSPPRRRAGLIRATTSRRNGLGAAMRTADVARLRRELENGIRMAQSLGLDVSEVQLPRLAA